MGKYPPDHQTTSDEHGAYPDTYPVVLARDYGGTELGIYHCSRRPLGVGESAPGKVSPRKRVSNRWSGALREVEMGYAPPYRHGPATAMSYVPHPQHGCLSTAYVTPNYRQGTKTQGGT